jgi:hypothetical protein
MATLPLNTFLTKTAVLTDNTTATVYTSPIGITSIVLTAQIANLTTQTQTVSFAHFRFRTVLPDAQGFGGQPGQTQSLMLREFQIPPNDAALPLGGKMIIEELDSIQAYVSNSGTCQLVLSILQTANQ